MSNARAEHYVLSPQLSEDFFNILRGLDDQHVIFRLWAKDPALFVGENEPLMLDWLEEPFHLKKTFPQLMETKKNIDSYHFSSTILLGMGGSSLSAKVFQSILVPNSKNNFFVLDTLHPSMLVSLEKSLEEIRVLFIIASKSGSTLEPNLLYRYFLKRLLNMGSKDPYKHFMAITDEGSPLEKEAVLKGFLPSLLGQKGIGGRYSGLTVFGLMPALLMDADIERLVNLSQSTAEDCGPTIPVKNNPAALLAAFFAAGMKAQKNQVLLHLSPSLYDFGLWLEQIIAESLGKNGKGLVPILDEGDRFFNPEVSIHVVIKLAQDPTSFPEWENTFYIQIEDRYEIGGLMFLFQVAVSLLGYVLKVNPFNQPDVEKSKLRATEIIEKMRNGEKLLESPSYVRGLSVYGDIKKFFFSFKPGDYCAVLSYLAENFAQQLEELRCLIAKKFSTNVMMQIGPRYLHSTGQLFKGGENNGHFLVLTGAYGEDRPSSYHDLQFSALHLSQALGDILAMKQLGRSVIHVDIGQEKIVELTRIVANI